MTSIGGTEKGCERCRELAERRASGCLLDAEEAGALREHLQSCADCATDAALADLVAELDVPGPATALDAQTRERWVDDVLRGAEKTARTRGDTVETGLPANACREQPPATPVVVGRSLIRLWAAVVSVIVGAVVLFLGLFLELSQDRDGGPAKDSATATLLLAAGVAEVDGRPARAGDVLHSGEAIDVAGGRVGVTLCRNANIFLDAATRARLVETGDRRCEVRLDAGRLVANAHGLAPGTQLVVSSAAGSVRVTGTMFAVEVVGGEVDVRVLEGEVDLAVPAQAPRRIAASQAMRMAGEDVRPLHAAEAERDRRLADWFPQAGVDASAVLDISSVAPSVDVVVDERTLGPAPVTALVAPGRHVIEVRGRGGPPVREVVEVRANEQFQRSYVLRAPAVGTERASAAPPVSVPANSGEAIARSDAGGSLVASPLPERSRVARDRDEDVGAPDAASPADVPAAGTAADLLDAARRLRTAADWTGAAATYEELKTRFPDSAEARVALVPLGQLRLERLGDAAGALRAFEEYLARSASAALREEASWGRIQALRGLGRAEDEVGALRGFLAAHPASLRANAARQRLAELEGAP
jgi:hypothetical protein